MRYVAYLIISCLLTSPVLAKYLPPTVATQGMVVSEQKIASTIGAHILKAGGNAIDAAVATGYALAVVDPCCGNIGGGGFMLIHLKSGKVVGLNFRETAPANIAPHLFFNNGKKTKASTQGYLSVGVPGTVMGLNTALKKYGTMSLQTVMQPAIQLAKKGFPLTKGNANLFNHHKPLLLKDKHIANIFFPKNRDLNAGQYLTQPQLAHTLTMISKRGSQYFYQGPIAQSIVDASRANGGVLSLKDFKQYQVRWVTPITCHYRGLTIKTMPLPSSGTTVCEILSILNGFSFPKNGFHSALVTNLNIHAMQAAFNDRNQRLGDPTLTPSATQQLLSPAYIQQLQKNINHPITTHPPGNTKEKLETTHYAVIDQYGNAVSVTYTLNGFFGAKRMAGSTGFFLNNELDDFTLKSNTKNQFHLKQGEANLIAPNKQPLSSMSPTLVLKHKKLMMILGAAGGPTIITQIVQTIENVIDFGMDIQAAINSPHYHMQGWPDITFYEPYSFSRDTQQILKNEGHRIQEKLWGKYSTWGQQAAIDISDKTGLIYGANDARRPEGAAVGVSHANITDNKQPLSQFQ